MRSEQARVQAGTVALAVALAAVREGAEAARGEARERLGRVAAEADALAQVDGRRRERDSEEAGLTAYAARLPKGRVVPVKGCAQAQSGN